MYVEISWQLRIMLFEADSVTPAQSLHKYLRPRCRICAIIVSYSDKREKQEHRRLCIPSARPERQIVIISYEGRVSHGYVQSEGFSPHQRGQCVVLHDGAVVPCTTLDRSCSAGNVHGRSLMEIWTESFAALRA